MQLRRTGDTSVRRTACDRTAARTHSCGRCSTTPAAGSARWLRGASPATRDTGSSTRIEALDACRSSTSIVHRGSLHRHISLSGRESRDHRVDSCARFLKVSQICWCLNELLRSFRLNGVDQWAEEIVVWDVGSHCDNELVCNRYRLTHSKQCRRLVSGLVCRIACCTTESGATRATRKTSGEADFRASVQCGSRTEIARKPASLA